MNKLNQKSGRGPGPGAGMGRRRKRKDKEEKCGLINKDKWITVDCTEENKAICKFQSTEAGLQNKQIPDAKMLRKYKYPCIEYFAECNIIDTEPKKWEDPRDACRQRDAELVIPDANGLSWILMLAPAIYRNDSHQHYEKFYVGYQYLDNEKWPEFRQRKGIAELFLRKDWDDKDHGVDKQKQCFAMAKESSYMWEPELPFLCIGQKFYGDPPEPQDNNTIVDFDPTTTHPKGAERSYKCEDGYHFEDSEEVTWTLICSGNEPSWDKQLPKCISSADAATTTDSNFLSMRLNIDLLMEKKIVCF